jgi:hypothetical protein
MVVLFKYTNTIRAYRDKCLRAQPKVDSMPFWSVTQVFNGFVRK